jgi:hypothetical protein
MPGPRGRRELTITQVTKQLSTGQSWLRDWMREVSAKVNSCQDGRLCCLKNVVARFIGLAPLSLRGAKRRSNLGGEPNEIATPRQVGARNDKRRPRWVNQGATEIWRRDLRELVSSLVLALVRQASPDLAYCVVSRAGQGKGWLGLTSRTTISAYEAFSTGRVPVGRGR